MPGLSWERRCERESEAQGWGIGPAGASVPAEEGLRGALSAVLGAWWGAAGCAPSPGALASQGCGDAGGVPVSPRASGQLPDP